MGIYEETRFQVVCDEPKCYQDADFAASESAAERYAVEAGFVKRLDGSWQCDRHAPPEKSRKKKR